MRRLYRPIVHSTVNRPQRASVYYEHLVNLARKEKEREREGRKAWVKERRQTWAEILRGYSGLNLHKLQPVGEILTESVAQPCSIKHPVHRKPQLRN